MPRNPKNPGQVRGERHPASKLTWNAVRAMRGRWHRAADRAERADLVTLWMARYQISQPALWYMLHGRTWRDTNHNRRA